MTTTTAPAPNLVPTLDSAALPKTPANEWADSTIGLLGAHVTHTPVGTPGPAIPGAFTGLQEPDPPSTDANGETLLDTAKTYLPAQADVQRAMTDAGQVAKAYLPQSVAAYLPSTNESTTPTRPALPTESSAASNLSTEAQAGSLLPRPDSVSTPGRSTPGLATPDSSALPTPSDPSLVTSTETGNISTNPVLRQSMTPAALSGYAASSESGFTPTSSESGFTPTSPSASASLRGIPAPPNSVESPDSSLGAGGAPHLLGSAALNSSRPEDNVPAEALAPSGTTSPLTFSDPTTASRANPRVLGSAALNSSRPEDNLPADALMGRADEMSARRSSPPSSVAGGSEKESVAIPVGTPAGNTPAPYASTNGHADTQTHEEDAAAEGEKEGKEKKPKLIARIKEKMHVGGSS